MQFRIQRETVCDISYQSHPITDFIIVKQQPHQSVCALEGYAQTVQEVSSIINKMSDEELEKILSSKTDYPISFDNFKKSIQLSNRVAAYFTAVVNQFISRWNNLTEEDFAHERDKDSVIFKLSKDDKNLSNLFEQVKYDVKRGFLSSIQRKINLPVKFTKDYMSLVWNAKIPATLKECGFTSKQNLLEGLKLSSGRNNRYLEFLKLREKFNDEKIKKTAVKGRARNWKRNGYDSYEDAYSDLEYGIMRGELFGDDYSIGIDNIANLIGNGEGYETEAWWLNDAMWFGDKVFDKLIKLTEPEK